MLERRPRIAKMHETPGRRLIQGPRTKEIREAAAARRGREIHGKAAQAVIMCAGGYAGSNAAAEQHWGRTDGAPAPSSCVSGPSVLSSTICTSTKDVANLKISEQDESLLPDQPAARIARFRPNCRGSMQFWEYSGPDTRLARKVPQAPRERCPHQAGYWGLYRFEGMSGGWQSAALR